MIDDKKLGLDTFTELSSNGRFIKISKNVIIEKNKMQLEEVLFIKPPAVICYGRTCFYNCNHTNIIKLL